MNNKTRFVFYKQEICNKHTCASLYARFVKYFATIWIRICFHATAAFDFSPREQRLWRRGGNHYNGYAISFIYFLPPTPIFMFRWFSRIAFYLFFGSATLIASVPPSGTCVIMTDLTQCPIVVQQSFSDLRHHRFRWWFGAHSVPSHFLNWRGLINNGIHWINNAQNV